MKCVKSPFESRDRAALRGHDLARPARSLRGACRILLLGSLAAICSAQPVEIGYEMHAPGLVSLGVYDPQGHLVRTLQSGKRQSAGKFQVTWDGTDQQDRASPPGRYELRGLGSDIHADYLMTAGNPGQPPYATADGLGGWNGHWGNPMALANDGRFLYAQFSNEEVWGSQLKLDQTGRVQWKANLSQADGNGLQLAMATDGKYVYVAADVPADGGGLFSAERRAVVWRTKADTGEYALWNQHGILVGQPYHSGSRPFWELLHGDKTAPPTAFGLDGGPSPRGLAVRDDKLYVSLYRENKIEVWDTLTAKRISEIPGIPKPQGLAMDAGGNLFAASEASILCIGVDGKVRPVVTEGLVAPYGIAVDTADNLYVTDLGSSQQVKKFSPEGRLIWTSGRMGGRTFGGKYERGDFLFPVGITVMTGGVIHVSEDAAPRRIVALDEQGRITSDWVGTIDIGAGCGIAPDEADPSLIYINQAAMRYGGALSNIIRLKLDFERKAWRVDAYWMGAGAGGPRRESMPLPDPHRIDWGQGDYLVRHFAGHTYLFSGMHWIHPIWEVQGYSLRPCAALGQSDRMLPADLDKGYEVEGGLQATARNSDRPFIWRDLDGDGLVSKAEVEFFTEPKGMGGHGSWGAYLDHQMNAYLPDSIGTGNVYKLPCLGIDAGGNPIYSWAKAQVAITAKEAELISVDAAQVGDATRAGQSIIKQVERLQTDEAGNIFGTAELMGHDKGVGWAAETFDVKVAKWDASGHRLWRVGVKARGFSKPGEFYTGKGVDGLLRGFAFFTDENGQSRIYSGDGLYAGSIPKNDPSRGAGPGPDTLNIEYCGGRVVTDPKTDADYFLAGDGAGLRVWRLEGLKQAERFAAPFELGGGALVAGAGVSPRAPDRGAEPSTEGWTIAEGVADLQVSNLAAVAFATDRKGAAISSTGRNGILSSRDGGMTWQHAEANYGTDAFTNLMDVTFSDAQTGWIIGRIKSGVERDRYEAMLLRSDDAGASWRRAPLPPEIAATNAQRAWFDHQGNGWILPYSGALLFHTSDFGKSWKKEIAPVRQQRRGGEAWHVFDAAHLILGAPGGYLAETRDTGATWTEIDTGFPDLIAGGMAFYGPDQGWITGRHGIILHTADGGKTWSQQNSGVPNDLTRVQFVSPSTGYTVAFAPKPSMAGVLLSTTDGGKTWANISPVGSSLAGLFLLDPNHGWAVGGRGGGYETPMMILRYAR